MDRQDKPSKPTKEGPLLFVFFESPFTSVSTVSRGHPSLVSQARTVIRENKDDKKISDKYIKLKRLMSLRTIRYKSSVENRVKNENK